MLTAVGHSTGVEALPTALRGEGGDADHLPEEAQRLRLEQCTQRQTALLLGAIIAPARSKLDELSQPHL